MIDSHAHLMFPEFRGDLEGVFDRAREAGLEAIVNVGCGIESSREAVKMADGVDFLFASVGLHPYDAAEMSDELLKEWRGVIEESDKVVALGETGLDFAKAKVSIEVQEASFRRHLKLAEELALPVIVHSRGAEMECLNILKEYPEVNAVFHCYGGGLEVARLIWNEGYLTSFTGIITYPNAAELRDVVKAVPMDLFMVETDCPYLAPQGVRGKRNEPAHVAEVLQCVAEVKGMKLVDVDSASDVNAFDFFGI